MFLRWFGDPAVFMASRPFHERIATPIGTKCLECDKPIAERDRGYVAPCTPRLWGHWQLMADGQTHTVCSYHLACFLAVVENGQTDGTMISHRMEGATSSEGMIGYSGPLAPPVEEKNEETHQPGRGWKRA